MFAALLATLFFSFSAVAASRMTRILGGVEANFWRIVLATFLLGLYAHTFGSGFGGDSLFYFLISGLVGFGIGDLALYQALPILGSRLSMILVHCLAAPISAAVEWAWLGTTISPTQALSSLVILAGVAIALSPQDHLHLPGRLLLYGIICGAIAAFGQGMGAVISRKAYMVAEIAGQQVDGITAAYQRIWGGVAVAALSFFILKLRRKARSAENPTESSTEKLKRSAGWVTLNAFCGPALGVSCFQWALKTTPTGIVLPIVALTPLAIIPLAMWMEGERPSRKSLLGGALAVAGVVALRSSIS